MGLVTGDDVQDMWAWEESDRGRSTKVVIS